MSRGQLRDYVISYPNDKEALKSGSSSQSYPSSLSPEEIEQAAMADVAQKQAK